MKYIVVIIAFLSFQFSAVNPIERSQDDYWMWTKWQQDFMKLYDTKALWETARQNFFDNLDWIRNQTRNKYFKYGLNGFADRNRTEFNHTMNRAIVIEYNFTNTGTNQYPDKRKRRDVATPPSQVDWRSKFQSKFLQPIKNQGDCGSCWAFAAVAVLESRIAIKYNLSTVGLSEQNFVDCVPNACNGGWPTRAYQYVQTNSGLNTGIDYSYTSGTDGHNGTCRYSPKKTHIILTGSLYQWNPSDKITEQQLMYWVSKGPVVVAIDASIFMLFQEGIYYCNTFGGVNHAVVIVGYGTNKVGDYWIIRNSWGTSWGDKGYIYITRNTDYDCGIHLYIMYPELH